MAKAASKLSRRLGEQLVIQAWEAGYNLHVHGFHEHVLDVEDVEQRLHLIESLVNLTKKKLKEVHRVS